MGAIALHDHLLSMPLPEPFDFAGTVTAHGWLALAPSVWIEAEQRFQRVERLHTGRVVWLNLASESPANLSVRVQHTGSLSVAEQEEICQSVGHMLRLDEDFSEFYDLCRDRGAPWNRLVTGRGRLLRSPSLFEDIVKTICTTNTTWAGTIRMVSNLVMTLGESYPGNPDLKAFPSVEAIATADPALFKDVIRLGYRGDYIQHIAQQVASRELDLQEFQDAEVPTPVLKKRLLGLRGVGSYAAHTLLMLLGRYEELAVDSEMRAFTRDRYFDGRTPTDREMRGLYQEWGRWKYLAYWFDLLPEGITL